ncbi:MAG: polymer-forming cytoskeletal protein, partial [Acetatifactor sp.]
MLKILTRMKNTIKRKRCAESILAGFLAICMAVTGIPFGKLQVQAEGEAEVYQIYATFPAAEGEITDFEIAETQPDGKELYAKLIRNGSYTVTAEDSNLPLWIDNAAVTNPGNYEVNFWDIRLSGNSSLNMGSYTISSTVDRFPALNLEPISQGTVSAEALQSFYNSSTYIGENAKLYDYSFTEDTTWTGWRNMETLIVNEGKTLTIAKGQDEESDFATTIEAQNAVINGTVLVRDSTLEAANMLTILDGGSLTVGDGAYLSGSGNGCLEIRGGATVSGITLYDGDGTTEFHDFSHTEMFAWNGENSKWVRQAGGGSGGGLPDNQYRIIKNGDGEHSLTVNGAPSQFDEGDAEREFRAGDRIEFTITGNVYKVMLVTNDSEQELTGTDGSYSYTPASESGFEIVVYTSEEAYYYDQCRPGEGEFFVEYQVRYRDEEANNGENKVTCDSAGLGGNFVSSVTYGEWTKLILKNEVTSVRLTITVAEGYEYVVNPNSISVSDDVIDWDVSSGDRSDRPEISFEKSGSGGDPDGPGPRPVGPEELKDYIEGQQYAFGDWDEDGNVDADDVKLGMAYQIFYPKFSQNPGLQDEYQLSGHQSLLDNDNIIVSAAPDKNITAKDAAGTNRTIPAYSYTVTLTSGESAEPITATGTAYAFSFSDDSKYQKNNRGCVIAVTEKNNVKSYFLRCANAYTAGTKSDTTLMVSGGNPGEAPIVVVSDFDVIYDEQEKTYDRKVSVFGNGAGLDTLFSQEEDKDIVAYQGRNENLIRDIGKGASWGSIFSVFTFCQKSFEGVQVQGSGASGNTPSWAF